MLAVVSRQVAQAPSNLHCTESSTGQSTAEGVISAFQRCHVDSVITRCQGGGNTLAALCYSHNKELFSCPRSFASSSDLFVVFSGCLENLPQLRTLYGVGRGVCEAALVLEAYRGMRDRGGRERGGDTADQMLRDFRGSWAFVVYDAREGKVFVARDHSGKFPFFWGTCDDGSLVISDSSLVMKEGCGKSFAPFPEGCFFSSKEGLKCYEHPNQTLKPIPHIDSQGQICGAKFEVEPKGKMESEAGKDWLKSF